MSVDVSHKHRVRYNGLSDPSLAGRFFLHEVRVCLLGTLISRTCIHILFASSFRSNVDFAH